MRCEREEREEGGAHPAAAGRDVVPRGGWLRKTNNNQAGTMTNVYIFVKVCT